MGLVKKISLNAKQGDKVKVLYQGQEIIGTVVEIDTMVVSDATITLENDKGRRWLLPINNIAILFTPHKEDVEEGEDDVELTYDEMSPEALKNLCDERGLEYRKSIKKKGLVNLLVYDDEQQASKKKNKKKK